MLRVTGWLTLLKSWLLLLPVATPLHGAFVVPPGFAVEKAAGEPQVRFPMFAACDDRGRLFVAESSGGDLYKEISAQTRLCKVRLLEDRDGDGTFEHSVVFADKVNFPMGLAWREGKLYLADPPELVALEDTDGDSRADKRTVLVTGFGHKDNGSLHGPTFGRDGWLYMTCGEPDGYKIALPEGGLLEGHNGALLRCRPDGSGIEVLARGFVNLVEVVFTPAGEIIGTDNWYQLPSGGIRDALVHLVPGGLYPLHLKDIGTPHPVLGDPLPPLSLFPAVALSGLARYEGHRKSSTSPFPAEMHGHLFAAEHNSRKVSRHALTRHGSTFAAVPYDFLSTDDPDFHPADVLEAPDGSLLVVDTGSWYIHHCPTGRIRKSPATGGIYRVRYKGPRGPKPVQECPAAAIWALAQSPDQAALRKLREALNGENAEVAASAARVLALKRDREAGPLLTNRLACGVPHVQLACAEALAACGGPDALPAVWRALEAEPDRFLEHALTYAAHHLADAPALRAALQRQHPRVQRAALLLLNQPPRPRDALPLSVLWPLISSTDQALRRTALGVLQARPEWVSAARQLLRGWAVLDTVPAVIQNGFLDLALAFKGDAEVQAIIASAAETGAAQVKGAALETIAHAALPETPRAWWRAVETALQAGAAPTRRQALKAAAALNAAALHGALARMADDASEPAELRLLALSAAISREPRLTPERFDFLLNQLRAEPLASLAAADVLKRAHLDAEQLSAVFEALPSVVTPGTLLHTLREDASPETGAKLLASLPRFASALSAAEFRSLEQRLPLSLQPRVQALRQAADKTRAAQAAKLEALAPLLAGGDAERGRAVFFDPRTACATCHALGSQGGKVGPDLTRIGAIRSGRDILESIVLPSSTFAQSYEPYHVVTRDEREFIGTLARQENDSILVRDATGAEVFLPRGVVRELRRGEVSLMPEGLEAALSEKEFRDLLAFLQDLK